MMSTLKSALLNNKIFFNNRRFFIRTLLMIAIKYIKMSKMGTVFIQTEVTIIKALIIIKGQVSEY